MINEVGKSNSIVKSCKHIIIKIVKKSKLKKNSSITKNKNDNSLGKLSKKFIDLFNASEDKIFQISDIIKKLKIQKRRLYDLTNVFEGNVSGSFIILKRNWIY